MSAPFRLFIDSSTGVDVYPEYSYTQDFQKVETSHRTKGGRLFRYKYGEFKVFKFGVEYVNSEFKSIVNSWWNTNTELLFMEVGATQVYSVRIDNRRLPVSRPVKPYSDLFKGKIELGTY